MSEQDKSHETEEYEKVSAVLGTVPGVTHIYNINTDDGDFVGRDNGVFLGRAFPTRQVINVSGDTVGDTVGGEYVGGDKHIYASNSRDASDSGDTNNNTTTIYPDATIDRIGTQIDRLRGRITRLIPAETALFNLEELREPKPINGFKLEEIAVSIAGVTARLRPKFKQKDDDKISNAKQYLDQLSEIEAIVVPSIEPKQYSQLLQSLSNIADEINIQIAQLSLLFTSIVYPTTTSRELTENLVAKIGHKEFKDEAIMHLGVISQLTQNMDLEKLTRPGFDVLSDEAYGTIGLMTELEKRRLVVDKLVQSDRRRKTWTVTSVITYICIVIASTIFAIIQLDSQYSFGQVPLSDLLIPVLGIPWPVIVWSLIGSFASMIYRFNSNPIYDFTDTIKWMITRPVQGVVLGSTLYLILVSGLHILTAGNVADTASLISTDEVILVLCFLVGFSDRFADSVFNTLVQRYSINGAEG